MVDFVDSQKNTKDGGLNSCFFPMILRVNMDKHKGQVRNFWSNALTRL